MRLVPPLGAEMGALTPTGEREVWRGVEGESPLVCAGVLGKGVRGGGGRAENAKWDKDAVASP